MYQVYGYMLYTCMLTDNHNDVHDCETIAADRDNNDAQAL